MRIEELTRLDAKDSPYEVTDLNVEIAVAYAIRSVRKWKQNHRFPDWMDEDSITESAVNAVLRARDKYDIHDPGRASWFTYCKAVSDFAILLNRREQTERRNALTEINESSFVTTASRSRYDEDGALCRERILSQSDCGECLDVSVMDRLDLEHDLQIISAVACEVLNRKECGVFILRHLKQMSLKSIARVYGCSPSAIQQMNRKVLSKLQKHPKVLSRIAEKISATENNQGPL